MTNQGKSVGKPLAVNLVAKQFETEATKATGLTFGRRRSPYCLSSCFPRGFRNFNKKVGVIVEMENISSCLNYVELLFTNNRKFFSKR